MDISVLNGGTNAWVAAGLPIETSPTVLSKSKLDITFSNKWTATTPNVAASAENNSAVLVDARTPEFYQGDKKHNAASRPDTAPGAVNYIFSKFFSGESTEIQTSLYTIAIKQVIDISDGDEIVSFCNTGHWAAINWFALSEIGNLENI